MLKSSIAIFQKEVRQEMRTKYAINTLLAFTGASLLVVLFTL
jgi:heme exporter protein B